MDSKILRGLESYKISLNQGHADSIPLPPAYFSLLLSHRFSTIQLLVIHEQKHIFFLQQMYMFLWKLVSKFSNVSATIGLQERKHYSKYSIFKATKTWDWCCVFGAWCQPREIYSTGCKTNTKHNDSTQQNALEVIILPSTKYIILPYAQKWTSSLYLQARRQMINPNIASPPLYHKLDITSTRSPPAVIRLVNQA